MPISHNNFKIVGDTSALNIAKLDMALSYLQSNSQMAFEIGTSQIENKVTTININDQCINQYNFETKTISWDPGVGMIVQGPSGIGTQSAALLLGHEFAHGNDAHFIEETSAQQEAHALQIETHAAREFHEPTRSTYESVLGFQGLLNPTEHSTIMSNGPVWTETAQNGSIFYGEQYNSTLNALAPQLGPLIDSNYTSPFTCSGYWEVAAYNTWSVDDIGGDFDVVYVSDPVIVNFAGNSVSTVSLADSEVRFDLQNNGTTIKTGWLTPGEGFLAQLNVVNSVKDLVPNLAALKLLDTNHDGKLSALDMEWNNLKVWADTHQGKFIQSDMHTLKELGIISINLNIQEYNHKDHGNTILDRATITFDNGSSGEIASVAIVGQSDTPIIHT